jgi:hypothetical protein
MIQRIAWAEELAQEHRHQRELLATLHGQLGTFAEECAAALTALDALVDLGAVAGLLDVARTGSRNAALARDIARRLPGLARTDALRDEQLSGYYTRLGGQSDLSTAMVHQTGELLRADPLRADGMLLKAIIDAAGARLVIKGVVGPASVTALNALKPLAHWAPALARLGEGDGSRGKLVAAAREDLTAILESIATAAEEPIAADSIAVTVSLQDTVEHVENAARAIAEGQLEEAIAEGRLKLGTDLDELRALGQQTSHAEHTSRAERHIEHSALVAQAREELAKAEKIRRTLGLILPHVRVTARALATIEKSRRVEGRLDAPSAAGVEAARMSLLLAAAAAFEASLPESRHPVIPPRPLPTRRLVGAALVLAAAAVAIAVSLIGGFGNKAAAANMILAVTPFTEIVPPPPILSPIRSEFLPQQKATFYSISVRAIGLGKATYVWRLTPPKDNQSCNKFSSVVGAPDHAIWHHAISDGCAHTGSHHVGIVTLVVTTRSWSCAASFVGTLTATSEPPEACTRI